MKKKKKEKNKIKMKKENFIKYITKTYKAEKENLINILDEIQEEYKYIPIEFIDILSEYLNIKPQEIKANIKFYKKYTLEEKGKNIITICKGPSCLMQGMLNIEKELKNILNIVPGETTENKLFSIETTNCFGRCAKAPVIKINDTIYERITKEKLIKIIKQIEKEEKI